MNHFRKYLDKHLAAFGGTVAGIAASSLANETPHKYGIGIITGCMICFVVTKVLNFIDKRTG